MNLYDLNPGLDPEIIGIALANPDAESWNASLQYDLSVAEALEYRQ